MSKSRNCVHEYRRVDVNDYHRQRICNLCGRIENWMPDQYGNWHCDDITCPHIWTHIHDSRECEWCGEVQRLVSTQYTKGECKPIDTWKTIKKVSLKTSTDSCKCEQSTAEKQCSRDHHWEGPLEEGDRVICPECGEKFEVVTEETVERKLVWRALRYKKAPEEVECGREGALRTAVADRTRLREELGKLKGLYEMTLDARIKEQQEHQVTRSRYENLSKDYEVQRDELDAYDLANKKLVKANSEMFDELAKERVKNQSLNESLRQLQVHDGVYGPGYASMLKELTQLKADHKSVQEKLIKANETIFKVEDDNGLLQNNLAVVRDENKELVKEANETKPMFEPSTMKYMGHGPHYWMGLEGLKENYRHQLKEAKEKLNSISSGICLDPDFMIMGETSRFWLGLKWDHGVQKAQLEKGRKEYKELEAKFESVCRLHMHELNGRMKAQDDNGVKATVIDNQKYQIRKLESCLATCKKQNQRRWGNKKKAL